MWYIGGEVIAMPRTKEEKYEYDQQYLKTKIFTKPIPFNRTKLDDMKLLNWAESKGNFTQYIKRLIREDMERRKEHGEG